MTRARILELLDALVLELGNSVPAPGRVDRTAPLTLAPGDIHYVESPIADAEWAYVKGLAAGAVLRFRDQLARAGE